MLKASVIISIYNRIEYLKLVLAGLERQTFCDFEIIIADDGSNRETINEIEYLSFQNSLNLVHIWQTDNGFRKNKILNRAVTTSNTNYLIFIDGDCIPHKEFIKEHFNNKKKNLCLTGRRVNLSKRITDKLTIQNVHDGFLEKKKIMAVADGIFGKSLDIEKGFYFKNEFLRRFVNKKKRGLLGCNFSIYKEDLLKINGFDERFIAPSIGEDSDVQFRLELTGIKIASLNNIAIQYHLFHKPQTRLQKNLDLFEEIKKAKISFTPYGIIQ